MSGHSYSLGLYKQSVCTKVGSAARIHEKVQASHPHISEPHSSTHALAKHTPPHIRPATYLVSLACSVRVCVQQRCHHLWPGLFFCGIMQRQFVMLCKRRQNATSARHTGRQAGALVLPSILVATGHSRSDPDSKHKT